MQSLFWFDDERFVEVENHIPEPFGMGWIRKNQKSGWKMRFYDTKVYFLSDEVSYSVSLRETEENGKIT
jgi:hypothetical protein